MCNSTDPKILMEKNGKQVPFSPGQVSYMEQNGWTVVPADPEPEPEDND